MLYKIIAKNIRNLYNVQCIQCTSNSPPTSPGDNTPSANSYTLPSLLGSKVPNKASSSSYSMAARALTGSFSEDLAKTPGPGRYNAVGPDTYVMKSPAYSMLGRSYMPGGTATA